MTLRPLTLFLLVSVAAGAAFVPMNAQSLSTTALPMKFLKDLGFEKPSWLPDFGGGDKKEEEKPKETEEKETAEEGETAAADAEE